MSGTTKTQSIDHDALFKRLLNTYLFDFIRLFIPGLMQHIDASSLTFLDKELFVDIMGKDRRESDIVAKVRFRDSEVYFIILVEPMSYSQTNFPARLLLYLALLYKDHGLLVYPIVLYSYDEPYRPEPDTIRFDFPNKNVLTFNYEVIQLNRLNWKDFVDVQNPIASALMAKMKIDPKDKAIAKAACMKMMLSLELSPEESSLIAGIIHTYIRLTPAESVVFDRATSEFDPALKEKAMLLTNPWEEKGMEKGMERGSITEAQRLTLRLIGRRFGDIPENLEGRIRRLSLQPLEDLHDSLFDFSQLNDVDEWLKSHAEDEIEADSASV